MSCYLCHVIYDLWDVIYEAGDNGTSLTGGAPPHEADELLRPRLPRHPPEHLAERVRGQPAVLRTGRGGWGGGDDRLISNNHQVSHRSGMLQVDWDITDRLQEQLGPAGDGVPRVRAPLREAPGSQCRANVTFHLKVN